jgi:hypothetical protein
MRFVVSGTIQVSVIFAGENEKEKKFKFMVIVKEAKGLKCSMGTWKRLLTLLNFIKMDQCLPTPWFIYFLIQI